MAFVIVISSCLSVILLSCKHRVFSGFYGDMDVMLRWFGMSWWIKGCIVHMIEFLLRFHSQIRSLSRVDGSWRFTDSSNWWMFSQLVQFSQFAKLLNLENHKISQNFLSLQKSWINFEKFLATSLGSDSKGTRGTIPYGR